MTLITADRAWMLPELVEYYSRQDAFVFDLETRPGPGVAFDDAIPNSRKEASLDRRTNEVYWISMATYGRCDVIPLGHEHGEQIGWQQAPLRPGAKSTTLRVPKFSKPPSQMLPGEFFEVVRPLFFNPDIRKANHNVKFDLESVAKYFDGDVPVPPYGDTIVAKNLLREDPPHGLEYCVPMEFKYKYDKIAKVLHTLPFSKAATYSHCDAKYTWLLWRAYLKRLGAEGLLDYFWMECDVTEVLVDMEMTGAPVMVDEVGELDVALSDEMEKIAGQLFAEAGKEFSLTSRVDQAWFIYEVCGHAPWMFTPKKNEPSTAAAALESYKADARVSQLMRWNDLHKLHSTYAVNLANYAAHDGRIHADFKQHATRTGRFACGSPNLQNIPKPDTLEGKRIRALFWGGE